MPRVNAPIGGFKAGRVRRGVRMAVFLPALCARIPSPYDTGVAKRMPMAAATASDNAHPKTHTPIARAVLL